MDRRTTSWALAAMLLLASRLPAQQCDDFNECTANDMCSGELCMGTPSTSGACDDFNECTINDRCQAEGCMGDPAPVGTGCGGGCGTCQEIGPIPIPGFPPVCMGDAEMNGQPCDALGEVPCLDGRCQITQGFAFCFPSVRECPDTDGNPCTDRCNFETDECDSTLSPCVPVCETCNLENGQCRPANQGVACDDFNPCTAQSRCGTVENRGLCVGGAPTVPTSTPTLPTGSSPTPTATQIGAPTATPTTRGPTATPAPCMGDCNDNGRTTVDELLTGIGIGLGSLVIEDCPEFDLDENNQVAVHELVPGLISVVRGCSGAPALSE